MGDLTIRNMTEADLDQMMAEHKTLNPDLPIRPDIKNALDNWAEHGLKPGDFLTAVLENNLMEALGRADSYNRATIFQISQYLYNDMPSPCHGSPEKVKAWAAEFVNKQ